MSRMMMSSITFVSGQWWANHRAYSGFSHWVCTLYLTRELVGVPGESMYFSASPAIDTTKILR
jgi:hypothetical protein